MIQGRFRNSYSLRTKDTRQLPSRPSHCFKEFKNESFCAQEIVQVGRKSDHPFRKEASEVHFLILQADLSLRGPVWGGDTDLRVE